MTCRSTIDTLLFCGLFALFPFIAPAADLETEANRNYLINTWQTDNGLPQNWISSIVQTPDGYLWIGTRYGGLARFDGVRFVNFNQQNTPELKDVQVEHMTVDEAGRLWIIMGNESITALQDGKFHLYRWPRSEPRLRASAVLNTESNAVLFSGELPYLTKLDLPADTNGWTVLDPSPAIKPLAETLLMDGHGIVWFVTQAHHLGRFSNGNYEKQNMFPGQVGTDVTAVALDATRTLWMATRQHLQK